MKSSRITRSTIIVFAILFVAGLSIELPAAETGMALCIGLNRVDPKHYMGWSGKLTACEFDAKDMAGIAEQNAFKTKVLLTVDAKRDAVLKAIRDAAKKLVSGDIFMISYSGHGGQVKDTNGDEADGLDETWCLFDGELIDDELYNEWSKFQKGVRILVFSDSCHSGSILQLKDGIEIKKGSRGRRLKNSRAMPPEIAVGTYRAHKEFYDGLQQAVPGEGQVPVVALVQSISACRDDQESGDGTRNGVFTGALRKVWNDGKFKGTYDKFYEEIRAAALAVNPDQEAQQGWVERKEIEFSCQQPFTVAAPPTGQGSK